MSTPGAPHMPLPPSDLALRFRYYPPNAEQSARYRQLREKAYEMALLISDLCPDSRERSHAITQLEDALMWANASIARHPLQPPTVTKPA